MFLKESDDVVEILARVPFHFVVVELEISNSNRWRSPPKQCWCGVEFGVVMLPVCKLLPLAKSTFSCIWGKLFYAWWQNKRRFLYLCLLKRFFT